MKNSILETQTTKIIIGNDINVKLLVKQIVDQQSGRYNSFLINFSDGFQSTILEMYKWILYPLIKTDVNKLEAGVKYSEKRKEIQSKHPRGSELNTGNLTQSLKLTASLQVSKRIQPIILDYDETNLRLNVVDKGSFQDQNELLELSSLPIE
ncbi:hypothetical protein R4Z10_08320 [Niallia sp. XMNu-256]|uniref:hypothetical protein n=1 Tax=Niallia sp. XMNu-256 TaxID=3082444 RepID=UPI0030CF6886